MCEKSRVKKCVGGQQRQLPPASLIKNNQLRETGSKSILDLEWLCSYWSASDYSWPVCALNNVQGKKKSLQRKWDKLATHKARKHPSWIHVGCAVATVIFAFWNCLFLLDFLKFIKFWRFACVCVCLCDSFRINMLLCLFPQWANSEGGSWAVLMWSQVKGSRSWVRMWLDIST